MELVTGQSAIVYPGHPAVLLQKLSHPLGVAAMLSHAQMQSLKAQIEDERVHGSGDGTQITHELCHQLGAITHLAESLHIGESVIALVGSAQTRELVGMGHPVKLAAIHHCATHL